MDKIFETIKEKLESPVLLNYFIGLLLFNRKVIYTALSMDYHDRVSHFYLYKGSMYNSKIEMLSVVYAEEQIGGCSTLYFWPVLYAIGVALALPYIKGIFNAVHENADIFYEKFRVWLNKMKTVSEETHDLVKADLMKARSEVKDIETLNHDLVNENVDYKEKLKSSKAETDAAIGNNNKLSLENIALKNEVLLAKHTLIDNDPSIRILFKGIWKATFSFHSSPTLGGGEEYMKIVNQCEMHTSKTIDGEYKLRCYIDRYQFLKNSINYNGESLNRINFKKTFVNHEGKVDNIEWATCLYILHDDNEIKGEEVYTNDGGITYHESIISYDKVRN